MPAPGTGPLAPPVVLLDAGEAEYVKAVLHTDWVLQDVVANSALEGVLECFKDF